MSFTLSPTTAALLADAILALHLGIVVFVVGMLPLILLGAPCAGAGRATSACD